MKTPTIHEFKAWAKSHRAEAGKVLAAQAFAECERERVAAYILPIFKKYNFQYGQEITRRRLSGPIPTPQDLYLCEDEERVAEYYEECDKAHRDHGFTGPHGHCPALVADADRIQAENALLEIGCKLFGLDHIPGLTAHRNKMLKLLLGACLVGRST